MGRHSGSRGECRGRGVCRDPQRNSGGKKGGKSQLFLPCRAVPAHTWAHGEGTQWFHRTCLPTALPCGKGTRGREGHGGGELKSEAVGRGIAAPGGRIQSQNKKKRWRMESKNRTKKCQRNAGMGRGVALACTHVVLSVPCPYGAISGVPAAPQGVGVCGVGNGGLTSCSCRQTLLKARSQLALARALGSCTSASTGSLQGYGALTACTMLGFGHGEVWGSLWVLREREHGKCSFLAGRALQRQRVSSKGRASSSPLVNPDLAPKGDGRIQPGAK